MSSQKRVPHFEQGLEYDKSGPAGYTKKPYHSMGLGRLKILEMILTFFTFIGCIFAIREGNAVQNDKRASFDVSYPGFAVFALFVAIVSFIFSVILFVLHITGRLSHQRRAPNLHWEFIVWAILSFVWFAASVCLVVVSVFILLDFARDMATGTLVTTFLATLTQICYNTDTFFLHQAWKNLHY